MLREDHILGTFTKRVLRRVWKQKATRENCILRLFIICTEIMEGASAGAQNISRKDKNPYKISVETPKRKITLQVCSSMEGQINVRASKMHSFRSECCLVTGTSSNKQIFAVSRTTQTIRSHISSNYVQK